MNLLIVGATRGIGRQLLEQSLAAGHQVRAMARTPASITLRHERLQVVAGDILDPRALVAALEGREAVMVSVGVGFGFKPVSLFSEGARILIGAMEKAGVRRLLTVTGLGAGDSRDHGGLLYDRIFYPLLLKRMYQDKDREERLIRNSGLDWTLVRPGLLTNGPKTAVYRAITNLEGLRGGRISRADVAHFMLEAAQSGQYVGQAPVLIY